MKVTGAIPAGLPEIGLPTLRLYEVEGILPLAAGCLLLAYIEGVSAARSFAEKHGYALNPRQEFLGIGAANLHGRPRAWVSGSWRAVAIRGCREGRVAHTAHAGLRLGHARSSVCCS